jgi:hypothetical protein
MSLGKINDLSNCQSWTITLHGGLLCLHNSKSKAGSSLTWKMCMLRAFCQSFFGIFRSFYYDILISILSCEHILTLID